MGNNKRKLDADTVMKELIEAVKESYGITGELKNTAKEFSMSELKIRKILITAGVYHNEASDLVYRLYREGKSKEEIKIITGLGKSSVNGYLPYIKTIYKQSEVSLNARRIEVYRHRQSIVKKLLNLPTEDALWEALMAFQGYPFNTASGLPFTYELKRGRDGDYNRELVVSRRKESKTLAWSSVLLAFNKALGMQGQVIERPKALGDIRGISYIYPMLHRFGIIEVSEKTAEKMQLKGGNNNRKPKSLEQGKDGAVL